MRHCRRSTSHFGYDRSGKGWVFERKKEREREGEIRVETRGAEKRNRNPSYLSGYVFPPSVLAAFTPPPSFRWNKTSSSFAPSPSPVSSSFFSEFSFSSFLASFSSPPPSFSSFSSLHFSLFILEKRVLFFPRLTRFFVPSVCLHLGILSRFCRRAGVKFVFERVSGSRRWNGFQFGDEQRFNCWISFSNY